MRRAERRFAVLRLGWILGLASMLGVGPPSSDAGVGRTAPPAGQTYFTILVGLDDPYAWRAACLRFTEAEVCASRGGCGTWFRTEPAGPETAIAFELRPSESGDSLRLEGQARIDDRGEDSSIAGVGRVRSAGRIFNVSLTGRSTGRRNCARMLEQWGRMSR